MEPSQTHRQHTSPTVSQVGSVGEGAGLPSQQSLQPHGWRGQGAKAERVRRQGQRLWKGHPRSREPGEPGTALRPAPTPTPLELGTRRPLHHKGAWQPPGLTEALRSLPPAPWEPSRPALLTQTLGPPDPALPKGTAVLSGLTVSLWGSCPPDQLSQQHPGNALQAQSPLPRSRQGISCAASPVPRAGSP